MTITSRTDRTGVVQSLSSNPGAEEGTISRADYNTFMAAASSGIDAKAGTVLGASFVGTPRKFAIVFATPYPDALYSIGFDGEDARSYTFEAKTAAGFTINTNANTAIAGEVNYFTTPYGET